MKSIAKRPPKTLKERLFIKEYIETQNATEAAARVYDVSNRHSAEVIGNQLINKLKFSQELERIGLTDLSLAKIIKDATEATKVIQANIYVNYTNGERMTDYIRIEDWTTRLQAVKLALQLKGEFTRTQIMFIESSVDR